MVIDSTEPGHHTNRTFRCHHRHFGTDGKLLHLLICQWRCGPSLLESLCLSSSRGESYWETAFIKKQAVTDEETAVLRPIRGTRLGFVFIE